MQCNAERRKGKLIEYCTRERRHRGLHFFGDEYPGDDALTKPMTVVATFSAGSDVAAIKQWVRDAPPAKISTQSLPERGTK